MRNPPPASRILRTALSLPVALGAVLACHDPSPVAPDVRALGASSPASGGLLLSAQKGPDQQDDVVPFARDVFVIVGSTLRNPEATTADDAPLFNVAGVPLDLTWGDWKRASAEATALTAGHWTQVRLRLSGLVPGGVYSAFYATLEPDSRNPLCPNAERGLPLIAVSPRQAPDPSSFVAGADGTATFHARVAGDLFNALQLVYFIIYHADGQTYHPLANRGEFLTQGPDCRSSFGEDAMRQLVIFQKSF
jgi:hypothetical protein